MKKTKTKKNGLYRILSLFLCFMFLTFVGCAMEGGDDEEGGVGTSLLNSAVVLSRPADYFEKDYVGENASVYYYNKYAKEILEQLYDAYSNADYEKDGVSMFTGNSKYLYDAIRYSVKSVRNTYNSSNALTQQEVVIDLNNGWNWGVPEKLDIVLRNNGSNVTVVDDFTNHTKTYTYSAGFFTSNSDWSDILTDKVAYNKYYYHTNSSTGDAVGKYDGTNLQYYYSPSHNEDGLSGVMNYYQDALEYAIYMISLGYNRAEQPGFFNFETTFDNVTNEMTGMNVVGRDQNGADADSWEGKGGTVTIEKALEYAKDLYNRTATYVGITKGNKDDIVDFILNVVIGENAWGNETNKGQFGISEIDFTSTGASTGVTTKVNIDRNYEDVIHDILDSACENIAIGFDQESGEIITLDNPYPAAVVTTYPGNKFMGSYEGEDYAFQYADAAEYQSIVLNPMAEDLNELFTDLVLQFEYYDNPDENLTNLPAIDINIGLRYYSKDGECIDIGEGSITVDYMNAMDLDTTKELPDKYWFYFSDFESEADVYIKDEIKMQSQFINPFADSTEIAISGTTSAHKYYTVEDSLVEGSHGTHGVLNSEMFKDQCDYLEVYFDVQKDKTNPTVNYNYNFKVLVAFVKFGES